VFDLLEWAAQRAATELTADDAAFVRRCGQELRRREESRLTPEKLARMTEEKERRERKTAEWEATMARDQFLYLQNDWSKGRK
jgi:hypothetical protein